MQSMRIRWRNAMWALLVAGPMVLPSIGEVMAGEEGDACAKFAWNVSHEIAVMKQSPQTLNAGAKAGKDVPQVQLDKLYELKLVAQSSVSYAVNPTKPIPNESATGGLVRLRVEKPGLYRVSITSGHWIDIVYGLEFVKSKDFSRSRGCERPSKIVEFVLPVASDLILQFSGSTDQRVLVAITPVSS